MSSLELLWNMNLMSIKVVKDNTDISNFKDSIRHYPKESYCIYHRQIFLCPSSWGFKSGREAQPNSRIMTLRHCWNFLPSFLFSLYANQGSDFRHPGLKAHHFFLIRVYGTWTR